MGSTYYALVIGDGEEHIVPKGRREEILDRLERDEPFRYHEKTSTSRISAVHVETNADTNPADIPRHPADLRTSNEARKPRK